MTSIRATHIYNDAKLNIIYNNSQRAKRVTLKVNQIDRNIRVIVPGHKAFPAAKKFVKKNKIWITQQLAALPPAQPFEDGSSILFHGKPYLLKHISSPKGFNVDHEARLLSVYSPDNSSFSGRVRRMLISEARTELKRSSAYYANKVCREIHKISVRDTATRWGSCVTRNGLGNINYSWRLICAPSYVLSYVAAHECAHLVEPNHSKDFWNVCSEIYGDVHKPREWLKHNGPLLYAIGAKI